MAKYHINYEGKILPCRAKVKKCPYEEARHGSSYEELYPIVMSNYNKGAEENRDLAELLKTGEPIGSLRHISNQLETSRAPMETMIATLDLALRNVNSGDMPDNLRANEEAGINKCIDLYKLGDPNLPSSVPDYIQQTAHQRWVNAGRPRTKINPYMGNNEERRMYYNQLAEINDDLKQAEQWRLTHKVQTEEFKRNYRAGLTTDYNNYSKALNTSKMLTQPTWAYGKSKEQISGVLKSMNNVELLSLYDDLTVSDEEINKNLSDLNNFQYKRRTDISEAANDNIERWYQRNQKLAQNLRERKTERMYLSFFVAKELSERNVQFGG